MRFRLIPHAIASYILLTLLILYYRFDSIIINPSISDVFVVGAFSCLVLLIVYCSLHISRLSEALVFMPLIISLVFFVRVLPNIVLDYPPLQDPYYYIICSHNVLTFGTIQSNVGWWYPQSSMELNWPVLHILTAQLSSITGLDLLFFLRFLMPFIGVIFFLGVFVFSYRLFKNYGASLLAGLITSLSASTIFYQSEFHPQGLALTFFVFILICFFYTRRQKSLPFVAISLVFVGAFTLSHHFSTLFLALICIAFIAIAILAGRLFLMKWFGFLLSDITFLLILVVAIIGFYAYSDPGLLVFFASWSFESGPVSSIASAQPVEPLITVLLNLTQWIPIAAVVIAAPFILFYKKVELIRALILLFIIFIVGGLSMVLFFMPTDRMLALSLPLIGAICSIILFVLIKGTASNRVLFRLIKRSTAKRVVLVVTIIAISLAMVAGIFGSQTPAYFFKTSEPNSYYWYDNTPPSAIDTAASGTWSSSHIVQNSTFGVTFSTWAIPFYYGNFPYYNVNPTFTGSDNVTESQHSDYYVIDKNVHYDGNIPLWEINQITDRVYSGPNILIYAG